MDIKRPKTRGEQGMPRNGGIRGVSGNRGKRGISNRILSQAFALSHDSYSTIKTPNMGSGRREGLDFFTRRRGQRVERLIN